VDWQQIAALVIVAVAAVWLVRTQILAPRRGGCGGCGSCGSASGPARTTQAGSAQIVQIELELPRARRESRRY
jgi:FeoB-associated Cys-rich membrane protein